MKSKIRAVRERKGLSQTRLACITGLAGSIISDFELGKRQAWPKARKAISKALEIPEKELF